MTAWRHGLAATVAVALITVSAGCSASALDPTRMPVPGSYNPRDTYSVNIEFSSVLNLPGRAKVDLGGVQVGVLDHVELKGTTAVASIAVERGVTLPTDVRAELRQATVLGDVYIALTAPARSTGSTLADGDTITLAQTSPASNVEDLLRSMSSLVGGGTLNTLQQTVIDMNRAFPPSGQLSEMRARIAQMLHELADNASTINRIVDSTETISSSFVANKKTFERLLAEGPSKLTSLANVAVGIVDLIVSFRGLAQAVSPILDPATSNIIQVLSYVAPFVDTVATADTTIPVIADKLVRLMRDRLIPFFGNGGPKYTVTEVITSDAGLGFSPAERADDLIRQMQTMGLVK